MATHSCQRGPSEGCSLCCCPRLAWPAVGGVGRSRRWGLLQGPRALSPPACCRCPRTLQQENEPSLLLQQKGWSLAHLPVSRPTLHGDDSTGCLLENFSCRSPLAKCPFLDPVTTVVFWPGLFPSLLVKMQPGSPRGWTCDR